MTVVVQPGRVQGRVRAPPSKSHTHRALLLAALSGNGSVGDPLLSDDTRATLSVLQGLGMLVTINTHETRVGGTWRAPKAPLDCHESGTTLRLASAVAALQPFTTRFIAGPGLARRPIAPLLSALMGLGVRVESEAGHAPLSVTGPLQGGTVELPGDVSSQFVSALLLATPLAPRASEILIQGRRVSEPYIEITLHQLAEHGVRIERTPAGFRVPPNQRVRQRPYAVPGDYSSAAYLLAGAAITGGHVIVENLLEADPQGDRVIVEHLISFGASVVRTGASVAVEGGRLRAATIDVGACPDLFPVLCAVAACGSGVSRLIGAAHLRQKESDRIAAMSENLHLAGIRNRPLPDGIEVEGGIPKGIAIRSHGDHRVAMAMATLALASRGASTLPDENVVAKSYPSFLKDLEAIAGQVARA